MKYRLNSKGCVLFAMLSGSDYGTGLPKCGPAVALVAAQSGLGVSLCVKENQQQCKEWRDRVLVPFFAKKSISIVVPESFPRFDILQMYNNPKFIQTPGSNNTPKAIQTTTKPRRNQSF